MDDQKFEVILNRLLELSKEDKLNWKTTANSGKYLLTLKDSSIAIHNYGNIDFEFKNERGETVETVMLINELDRGKFIKARQLHDLARRKALNSDKTIDKILEQLSPDSITV